MTARAIYTRGTYGYGKINKFTPAGVESIFASGVSAWGVAIQPVLNASTNAAFNITSASLDATGTNFVVCWESVPGLDYTVMTNLNLASPQSWVPVGSPITASNTTTCFTLPGGTMGKSHVFVMIKQVVGGLPGRHADQRPPL